jgi:quercetin dioxygenase-like cupin family protein
MAERDAAQAGSARYNTRMIHYDWNSLPTEQLGPQVSRRAIHTPGLTIARLNLQKGAVVPEHSHVHEQIATVERGALQFRIGDEEVTLRDGQSVSIPSNVPHQVVALEDTVVVDVFSPCREDWLRGDDAYLRKK